jgi:hypothetical protein
VTADVEGTIRLPGWQTKVRLPKWVTASFEDEVLSAYCYSSESHKYELDSLIPIGLGGLQSDPRNRWPERYVGEFGAHSKDRLENVLRERVCSGQISLSEAQRGISGNWIEYYRRYFSAP